MGSVELYEGSYLHEEYTRRKQPMNIPTISSECWHLTYITSNACNCGHCDYFIWRKCACCNAAVASLILLLNNVIYFYWYKALFCPICLFNEHRGCRSIVRQVMLWFNLFIPRDWEEHNSVLKSLIFDQISMKIKIWNSRFTTLNYKRSEAMQFLSTYCAWKGQVTFHCT